MNKVGLDYNLDTTIPQVMNGLYRYVLHTGLSFTYMWYYLLGTYWGYVTNYIIIHLVAYFSLFLMLRKIFNFSPIISGISSTIFAWIPIYTILGLALSMQPLLITSFIFILRNKSKLIYSIPFLIFPFYTSFVWGAPSIITVLGLIYLYDLHKTKKIKWYPVFILFTMALLFIVANIQLIVSLIAPMEGFISHRGSYNLHQSEFPKVKGVIEDFLMIFSLSHYHAGTFFTIPILFIFLYLGSNGWLTKNIKRLLVLILLMSLFFGVYKWIIYFFGDIFPFIETFKVDRIVKIFFPLTWCLLLAYCLEVLYKMKQFRLIYFSTITILVITTFCNDEWLQNMRKITHSIKKPLYSQFYDKKLFNEIDKHIGLPKEDYRVVHLGLNPAMSQHFGFYSLDAYMVIYDYNYKLSFRKIMEEELAKDEVISTYFDDWGNRCYLLSHELGIEDSSFMFSKIRDKRINELSINTDQLKSMGGAYIFSSVTINNFQQLNLKEEGIFYHDDSYFKIHLYKVL